MFSIILGILIALGKIESEAIFISILFDTIVIVLLIALFAVKG